MLLLKVDSGHFPQDNVDNIYKMIWDFWKAGCEPA